MCIRKYEEHNIAYNDPAFEVRREKVQAKKMKQFTQNLRKKKLLKAISRKYIFFFT